ncbi:MAG: pirin family protein [Woeseiaceae bacterium]
MIEVRRSDDRGAVDMGWLKARHSFSFGDYYDPEHMGFGNLRVINEDRIEPAKGFGTHGHKDMEIVTYMIDGALEHKDSMGNGSVIRTGEVQRMSAGTGVMHSEFNHSGDERAHLLQIWILPERSAISPGWEEKLFSKDDKHNRLRLIASRDARDGSLQIHQSLDLFATVLDEGKVLTHRLTDSHQGWVQVVSGRLDVNGTSLEEGDGAAIGNVNELQMSAVSNAEFLLFDMA